MFLLFGVIKYEGETFLGYFDSYEKAKKAKKFALENPEEFDFNYFDIRGSMMMNHLEYYFFRDEPYVDEMRIFVAN